MNTLFSKIAACRDTLDGYSGAYTMTSALKKLRSSLKRAKMESKDVVVEHMLPLAREIQVAVELDATVVQATCGVVASFARQLGAAFAPFADVLLVPLLDAACVRRNTYCVEALAGDYSSECRDALCVFQNSACNPQPSYRRRMGSAICVVKLLGITVETCTKEELEPQYSLLKEFVREALHDNFLLVRVEARQVFSSLYDTWPERVNEFVYLPAPRIRAVLMADGYATTGIGLALQRKFQSKTPAAVKRRPSQGGRSSPCCQSTQRGGLSHAAGCAALGCAVHGGQWRYGSGCPVLDDACQRLPPAETPLDGYSGAYTMTSALKKLRSSLKRAKMESKDVVVEHMLPLAASVKSKLLSSLDATVVQATCGVVASFARQLGAAFAPFADVLLVPLLDAACVRRKSADDDAAISMASTRFMRISKQRVQPATIVTEGGWKRHLVVKLLGITVETCTKEELEPQYSLLKEFVREALHDNFLLVRVEARQVFSSLYDTWPERVNEFVYLPAPRIRAVLMADGYATTGIGLALQRKFQSKTPAAVKRDPPKVVGPRPAVNPPNVVDFHMLLVVQLLAVLFTATVAVWQRLPSFGRRMSKVEQPTRDPPVSKGKLVPSWNRPSIQRCKRARRSHPARTHGRRASGESSS
ncbi:hypothetical protein Ae201684P_010899 [Aphanomyces euteiches]|nr:hypothetical protein Ae201684P_010899 [Aphanomyces euteiches]